MEKHIIEMSNEWYALGRLFRHSEHRISSMSRPFIQASFLALPPAFFSSLRDRPTGAGLVGDGCGRLSLRQFRSCQLIGHYIFVDPN